MISEARINEALDGLFSGRIFKEEPVNLYGPLEYTIAVGGKRLRPRLCLTAYSLFADELDDCILQPAAGLEIFHSYTLIHDDVMDNSPLRRGKESVWKKWDLNTAILSGDVMCIDSFSRMAKAPAKVAGKVMEMFGKTAAGVCEGQQLDMDFEKEASVPMPRYMEMVELKTAVLLACSAGVGAMIGGASDEEVQGLWEYARLLGLAFQVADDWLDAYGDAAKLGKPVGGDIVEGKKSWLAVRALESASGSDRERLLRVMAMPAASSEEAARKISAVKESYDSMGIGLQAQAEVERLTGEALRMASEVCSGVRYARLRRFAEGLLGRRS